MAAEHGDRPTVVLVAEDEPLVRMMAIDMLEEAGFEVVEAVNGDEALQQLESRGGVQVLFTDVDMPGSLNGFQLARRVNQQWPGTGVLIASGKMSPGPHDMPPGARFLSKPYRIEAVVHVIREMLQ